MRPRHPNPISLTRLYESASPLLARPAEVRRLPVRQAIMARSVQGDRRRSHNCPRLATYLTPGADGVFQQLAWSHYFRRCRGWCPPKAAGVDRLRSGSTRRVDDEGRNRSPHFYANQRSTSCSPDCPQFLAPGGRTCPRALPAVARGIPRCLASPLHRESPALTRFSPYASNMAASASFH